MIQSRATAPIALLVLAQTRTYTSHVRLLLDTSCSNMHFSCLTECPLVHAPSTAVVTKWIGIILHFYFQTDIQLKSTSAILDSESLNSAPPCASGDGRALEGLLKSRLMTSES